MLILIQAVQLAAKREQVTAPCILVQENGADTHVVAIHGAKPSLRGRHTGDHSSPGSRDKLQLLRIVRTWRST